MSKLFLAAVLVTATLLPLVPPVATASSCAGSSNHVGDDENRVDPIFGGPFWLPHTGPGSPPPPLQPNCCTGPTIPVAGYYLSTREPIGTRVYHEAHYNGRVIQDPAGTIAAGIANPTDPQYELVSPGSYDVAIAQTAGLYIYQETNGQTGLQRGGTNAGIEDACTDVLAPGVLFHDTLVL